MVNRLANNHLQLYEELGRPRLSRYGINGMTLVFILKREHRNLGDKNLSLLSDAALFILLIELVLMLYPQSLTLLADSLWSANSIH